MTDQFPTVRTRRAGPLSVSWSLLVAPQSLMILLSFFAVALILGGLVPQVPLQARDDPQTWLALQPGLSGWKLQLVQALDLYDLFHAFWFRVLMVLIGLVVSVWFIDSSDLAWQGTAWLRHAVGAVPRWSGREAHVRIPTGLLAEEASSRLREFLEDRGYHSGPFLDRLGPGMMATRRGLLLWARPLGFGALLLTLVGLVIMDSWGWEDETWQPFVGETRAVGRGTPLAVQMDSFTLEWEPGGRLVGYHAQITWLDADTVLEQTEVAVGKPSRRQGVTLRLIGYVPVVKIRGRDESGLALAFQEPGEAIATPGEATVVFPTPDTQPLLVLPAEDLLLALTFEPLDADGRPALYVAVSSGEPEADQVSKVLYHSDQVSLAGLQLGVDLSYIPIVRVDHRPGLGLIMSGLILTLACLAVAWLAPGRLCWIIVSQGQPGAEDEGSAQGREGSTVVHLLTASGTEWTRWWHGLAEDLREELANGD